MRVFIYQAALLCEACGVARRAQCLPAMPIPFDPNDESSYDSDDYPKGPFEDGGGEADTPQHCDDCQAFLENPLTDDGVAYTREQIAAHVESEHFQPVTLWAEFYAADLSSNRGVK